MTAAPEGLGFIHLTRYLFNFQQVALKIDIRQNKYSLTNNNWLSAAKTKKTSMQILNVKSENVLCPWPIHLNNVQTALCLNVMKTTEK